MLSTTLICFASLVNLGPLVGDYNAQLRRVVAIDLVAIVALALAALIDFSHFREAGAGL